MSAQPRTVRVAAVQAIQGICTEVVRQKIEPSAAVVQALDFLQTLAADLPTAETPALDAHLEARGFGTPAPTTLARPDEPNPTRKCS